MAQSITRYKKIGEFRVETKKDGKGAITYIARSPLFVPVRLYSRQDTWFYRFQYNNTDYRRTTGVYLNELHPYNLKTAMAIAEARYREVIGIDGGHEVIGAQQETEERNVIWLVKRYLEENRNNFGQNQLYQRKLAVKTFFKRPVPLDEEKIYEEFIKNKNASDNGPRQLKKKMYYIRSMMDWAVSRRYIKYNPVSSIEIVSSKRKADSAVQYHQDEIEALRGLWAMPREESYELYREWRSDKYHSDKYKFRPTFPERHFKEYIRYLQLLDLSAMRPGELARQECADISDEGVFVRYGKQDRPRSLPYDSYIFPGMEEIMNAQLTTSRGKRLFPFIKIKERQIGAYPMLSTTNNIHKTLSAVVGVEIHPLKTLRATTINYWDKVLGLPTELIDLLAGNTYDVRRFHYNAVNEMKDVKNKITATRA